MIDVETLREHELKCWPQYFEAVHRGEKPFEIRFNDRDYKVGDILHLREWDPELIAYTGREFKRRVTYLTDFAQQPGFVVLGIELLRQREAKAVACKHEPFEGFCIHCGARFVLGRAVSDAHPAPDGWRLVPVEPTREMLNAAIDAHGHKLCEISCLGIRQSPQWMFERSYKAMLAAAPQPGCSA